MEKRKKTGSYYGALTGPDTHCPNQAGLEHREFCLPLSSWDGIKGKCHHAQLILIFYILTKRQKIGAFPHEEVATYPSLQTEQQRT